MFACRLTDLAISCPQATEVCTSVPARRQTPQAACRGVAPEHAAIAATPHGGQLHRLVRQQAGGRCSTARTAADRAPCSEYSGPQALRLSAGGCPWAGPETLVRQPLRWGPTRAPRLKEARLPSSRLPTRRGRPEHGEFKREWLETNAGTATEVGTDGQPAQPRPPRTKCRRGSESASIDAECQNFEEPCSFAGYTAA